MPHSPVIHIGSVVRTSKSFPFGVIAVTRLAADVLNTGYRHHVRQYLVAAVFACPDPFLPRPGFSLLYEKK